MFRLPPGMNYQQFVAAGMPGYQSDVVTPGNREPSQSSPSAGGSPYPVLYGPGSGQPGAAQPKQPGPFDPQRHVATGGKMSNGKPMAVYGPSAPMGGMAPQPQGRYAAGTSPEYMAANPDTLPYRPGSAQPTQPPSQGSPYGAWTGTQVTNQAPTQIRGGGVGNFAYSPQDRRPQPFTQNTSFGGMSGNAQDMFRQRDAFVQSINNSRSQHAAQWGQGQRQPPPRNFGQMMGQAQDMVKGGWQNPLAGLFRR